MTYLTFADQLLLISGMAIATYVSRVTPLLLLSSRELNPHLMRWLHMVPPAVLAALLAPEILLRAGEGGDGGVKTLFLSLDNIFLLATIPTVIAGWLTKSFFGTVAVGMGAVALLRWLSLG